MNKSEKRLCKACKATDFDSLHLYSNDVLFDHHRHGCLSIICLLSFVKRHFAIITRNEDLLRVVGFSYNMAGLLA